MTNTEKKPFDRSKRFTVYGSWMENFIKLEKYGVEVPYTLFKGIAEYALFGTNPDFSNFESTHGHDNELLRDMLEQIYIGIRPNIDTSVKNSKSNFSDNERNEKEIMVVNLRRDNPSMSLRDIELATGVPKTTVERILKKYGADNAPQSSPNDTQKRSAPEVDLPDDPNDLPF